MVNLNSQLMDVSVRTQVYIEDVKIWQNAKFLPVLKELSDNFKKIMNSVKYQDLNLLTKTEVNRLIAKLRISQATIYNVYFDTLLRDLKLFMDATLEVNQLTHSSLFFADKNKKEIEKVSKKKSIDILIDESKTKTRDALQYPISAVTDDSDKLWAGIQNEPLPINGVYLLAYLKTFVSTSQYALENLIRKGWANKWTVAQLVAQATAPSPQETPQGSASEAKKILTAQNAVVVTVMQHIAQQVQAAVASSLFEAYKWLSVIDSRTSSICEKLNLTKWEFGKGPLPPAHVHCRSHISPISGLGDIPEETFYTWIVRQSSQFQNDVLGATNARLLRAGKITSKDVSKYESNQPLDLEGFKSKVDKILNV